MNTMTADLAFEAFDDVGEGPIIRAGRLTRVDLMAGLVHESDLAGQDSTLVEVGSSVGAVAPRREGGLVTASDEGFGFLEHDKLRVVDPIAAGTRYRMNDAKVDPQGRLWAGRTSMDFAPGTGSFHVWNGRERSQVRVGGLSLPNGLGWSANGETFFFADSTRGVIFSAPFRGDNATLGTVTALVAFDDGLPDGLAVDQDGCVWVAIWGGGRVVRVTPEGKPITEVLVPVSQPSSCAFGETGALYITSARSGLSENELENQPLAGSVFVVATGTTGVPVPEFAS